MIVFDIEKHIPRFIFDDPEGYALAKAIEAGLAMANEIADDCNKCLFDYENMPEWRLDELAWETGCLYDYDADIEVKREWIRNARNNMQIIGTPYALKKFLEAKFEGVTIREWYQYGGDPYHFEIEAADTWSEEKNAWALKAVAMAKNLRTTMDRFVFYGGETEVELVTGINVVGIFEKNNATIN